MQTLTPITAEVAATVTGDAARGEGETFRLRPRWPSVAQLEYVQKLATSGLLVVGFLLLVAYGIVNPAGAFNVIVRGAKSRVGAA
jgi:hypothetical protein